MSTGEERGKKIFSDITHGYVIDHLDPKVNVKYVEPNDYAMRGNIYGLLTTEQKLFIKTTLNLTERDLKRIALLSPEPTINRIVDGNVVEKYNYILCRNTNCISRAIDEDVPPQFWYDDYTLRCRYCRYAYEASNPKITVEDLAAFVKRLPKSVVPLS